MRDNVLGMRGAIALCLASTLVTGCASVGPKPWEHDLLAKREMQMTTHPAVTAANEHIQFSKEGSAGGRTFDGEGCGCN